MSVASLRSRWNGAPEVIQTLEDEGLVLVTRTTKDGVQGQPKMVFWNDIQPSDGGKQIEPGKLLACIYVPVVRTQTAHLGPRRIRHAVERPEVAG